MTGPLWVRTTAAHGGQHLEHDILEASWLHDPQMVENLRGDVILHPCVGEHQRSSGDATSSTGGTTIPDFRRLRSTNSMYSGYRSSVLLRGDPL
jgi:hypothetical protein